MSIFFPDDVDRLIFDQFITDASSGGDDPPKRLINRKSNLPTLEQELRVPVFFWSLDPKHRITKKYPMILIQALGPRLSDLPQLVDLVRQVVSVGQVQYRQSPVWFEMSYQVTVASMTFQLLNELAWDVWYTVFPYKYGQFFFNVAGLNRPMTITPRGWRYDGGDPHVYRSDFDLSVRVPLFVDGNGSDVSTEFTIQEVITNFHLANAVESMDDVLSDPTLLSQSITFNSSTQSFSLTEAAVQS